MSCRSFPFLSLVIISGLIPALLITSFLPFTIANHLELRTQPTPPAQSSGLDSRSSRLVCHGPVPRIPPPQPERGPPIPYIRGLLPPGLDEIMRDNEAVRELVYRLNFPETFPPPPLPREPLNHAYYDTLHEFCTKPVIINADGRLGDGSGFGCICAPGSQFLPNREVECPRPRNVSPEYEYYALRATFICQVNCACVEPRVLYVDRESEGGSIYEESGDSRRSDVSRLQGLGSGNVLPTEKKGQGLNGMFSSGKVCGGGGTARGMRCSSRRDCSSGGTGCKCVAQSRFGAVRDFVGICMTVSGG